MKHIKIEDGWLTKAQGEQLIKQIDAKDSFSITSGDSTIRLRWRTHKDHEMALIFCGGKPDADGNIKKYITYLERRDIKMRNNYIMLGDLFIYMR